MLKYDELISTAKDCGFTEAGPLAVSTLEFLPEVRDMCASGRCQVYGKNWACPPACGSLDEIRGKIQVYKSGLLVQTVGRLEDSMDWDGIQKTAADQGASFKNRIRWLIRAASCWNSACRVISQTKRGLQRR